MTWDSIRLFTLPPFSPDLRKWDATITPADRSMKLLVRGHGGAIVETRPILPAEVVARVSAALSRVLLEQAANARVVFDDIGVLGMTVQAEGSSLEVTAPALTRQRLIALSSNLSDDEERVVAFCEMWRSIARLLPLPADARIP